MRSNLKMYSEKLEEIKEEIKNLDESIYNQIKSSDEFWHRRWPTHIQNEKLLQLLNDMSNEEQKLHMLKNGGWIE